MKKFWLAGVLLIVGCSPKPIQPQIVYETHTVHDTVTKVVEKENTIIRDRIVKDSTAVSQKGDSVIIHHWHYERDYSYEKNLQSRLDSLHQAINNMVPVVVEKPVEVEKKLNGLQKALMGIGTIAVISLLLGVYLYIRKLLKQ